LRRRPDKRLFQLLSHRKHNPEFAKQWDEARESGIELLHDRVSQRAIEGDLEPVFYIGVAVAYLRKFDSRLQIEMLRAVST